MERNHLEDLNVDGIIILRWILKQWDGEAWTGLNWLKMAGGRHLWMRHWFFGFHKMWSISWPAEDRLASQEGICFMELVSQLVSFVSRDTKSSLPFTYSWRTVTRDTKSSLPFTYSWRTVAPLRHSLYSFAISSVFSYLITVCLTTTAPNNWMLANT